MLLRLQSRRTLSYLIRHDEIMTDKDGGWTEVSKVIQKMQELAPEFDEKLLEEIVAQNKKKDTATGKISVRFVQIRDIPCQ